MSDDDNILQWKDIIFLEQIIRITQKEEKPTYTSKKSLALRKIELSHITECLLCEINVKGQVGFIIVGYRCPSQTSPQSDDFLSDFEKLFDDVHIFQPAFTVFLGDFNARSKSWWSGHSTAVEGTRLDSFFSSWFTSTDI